MEIASFLDEDGIAILGLGEGLRSRVDDDQAGALLTARTRTPLVLRPESHVPHHDEAPIHVVTTAAIRRPERLLSETMPAAAW